MHWASISNWNISEFIHIEKRESWWWQFIITSGTAGCRYGNLRCHQWWRNWFHNNSHFPVFMIYHLPVTRFWWYGHMFGCIHCAGANARRITIQIRLIWTKNDAEIGSAFPFHKLSPTIMTVNAQYQLLFRYTAINFILSPVAWLYNVHKRCT